MTEPLDEFTHAAEGDPATWGPRHSRTITWHGHEAAVRAGAHLSGLDYLTAMKDGRLPVSPIGRLVGLEAARVDHGDVVFRCIPDHSFYNPLGIIHGGFMCTLLDAAAASAVHTTLAAGVGYTTVEIKVNFLRAIRAGDEVQAHGWVTRPGSRLTFAEADIRHTDGKLIANATTSCLILPS
ncbi:MULTISPECIES: PaaI family thioesterase [Pseudofrankia]|uniref:PaaI family thioesterase n=1 Tax=Pseudofrankia TaxID=2994363 RepID=UPI000234B64B|nr:MULTISPECIES: PaaI family thioesterase [Pseudofrankia]OHV29806.1 aromatic compound degradation protein PaaI [Pseudofrankia sp. EUN1h]